jgi:7-cyano-7-deazaguanine synthase in queuosine biosynthesis
MDPVLDTLSIYIKPIGVDAFGESLFRVAVELERICRQICLGPARAVIDEAKVDAPGSLTARTLPDALWLAAGKRSPQVNYYPMGEIGERAFKRTIAWLVLFEGKAPHSRPDARLMTLEKNLRNAVTRQKISGVLAYFLTEYFFEVCRDSERRWKTGTAADPCYRYHFLNGRKARSLASESQEIETLLESCRQLADDTLPVLLQSISEKNPVAINDAIADITGLRRSMDEKDFKPNGKPPLNVILENKPGSDSLSDFVLDPNLVRFQVDGPDANIHFHYANLETLLARLSDEKNRRLHSLCKDLLDIAVVVYMADQVVKRESTLKRRLDIRMPVRHPKAWKDVNALLSETISFLGRDEVHFHFVKKKEKAKRIGFKVESGNRCVALLSGGLDSAAGVIYLRQKQLDPVLVSHYSSPYTFRVQADLKKALENTLSSSFDWLHLQVAKAKTGSPAVRLEKYPASPMAQFLRSFLFLSVASVLAIELEIERVFLFENGPIALNPMFSEARLNTRTAHPRFIAEYQSLIESLFKVRLKIENPFLIETKGEVVSRFAALKLKPLVMKTISCWGSFAVPARAKLKERTGHVYRHDGDCLPCVVRRAALFQAGLSDSDVPYLLDVFTEFPRFGPARQVLVADYLRFCGNLQSKDDDTLLLEHPDFSVIAPGVAPEELIDMYKRHCSEMIKCFRSLGSDETDRLALPE